MSERARYFLPGDEEDDRVFEVVPVDGLLRVTTPEGNVVDVDVVETDQGLAVYVDDQRFDLDVLSERERRMRTATGGRGGAASPELTSPMAGKVVKILAQAGATVEEGDPLVVVEAMKMENDLKAHRAGVVATIAVESGQAVEIGDLLLTIEDDGDGE